jgi:hypothetical protein
MVAYAIKLTSRSELVIIPKSSPLSTLSTRTHGTYSATLWFASVVELVSPEQLLTHYRPSRENIMLINHFTNILAEIRRKLQKGGFDDFCRI